MNLGGGFVTSRTKDVRGTLRRIVLDEREDGICASDPFGLLADGQVSVAQ